MIACNALAAVALAAGYVPAILGQPSTAPALPDAGAPGAPPREQAPWPASVAADGRTLTQQIPVSACKFDLAAVPGDPGKGLRPYWMGRTEQAWEVMDVFVYRLDEEQKTDEAVPGEPAKPDAQSRPSKPYIPPDRGFGHEGFAAISVTHRNAAAFCRWLSARTGRVYRLPTEAEWEHAARAGGRGEEALPSGATLGDFAWYEPNADDSPHPVGQKKPNTLGLHDLLGNVGEWVDASDGPVLKGGSYRDVAAGVTIAARARQDTTWNSTDPQVPKSVWWLSDAPFAGFRVVSEMTDAEARAAFGPDPKAPTPPPTPPPTR